MCGTMCRSPMRFATARKERNVNRAEEICSGVSVLHNESLALAKAVVLMSEKIETAIVELQDAPLVIPYDNGGGQTGIRENPEFVAFEKLMASYTKSLRQLTEIVEKGSPSQKSIGVLKELGVIAGKKAG